MTNSQNNCELYRAHTATATTFVPPCFPPSAIWLSSSIYAPATPTKDVDDDDGDLTHVLLLQIPFLSLNADNKSHRDSTSTAIPSLPRLCLSSTWLPPSLCVWVCCRHCFIGNCKFARYELMTQAESRMENVTCCQICTTSWESTLKKSCFLINLGFLLRLQYTLHSWEKPLQ